MIRLSPLFRYRGDRDFVNTASIYSAIMDGLAEAGIGEADGPIVINIRDLNQSQLDLFFCEPGETPNPPGEASIDFMVSADGESHHGWLTPTGEPVTERLPYDETIFDSAITISGRKLSFTGEAGYANAQIATSFARRLLQSAATPPAGQRWLCTRVNLTGPFPEDKKVNLEIELNRILAGRFARCAVRFSARDLGWLDFAISDK